MPLFNYLGGQEVSHQTSEQYKEKIIELMELDGFILVGSSSRVAMTPDLVFRKPILEGDIEIYVETKYDDISLSDKSFLTELGRYFILYDTKKDRPFDFYMFIRKCRNWNKWKQIFTSQSYNEETSAKLYNDMLEKAELNEDEFIKIRKTNFKAFERFLSDTYVNQISYDRLLMEIGQIIVRVFQVMISIYRSLNLFVQEKIFSVISPSFLVFQVLFMCIN